MKIAVVRGDFLSQWDVAIIEPWTKNNEVTLFLGKIPIYKDVVIPKSIKVENLFCPVDLNFGKVKRYLMAALNRIFIDAHVLFGLVWKLRGYDVVYTAETFYFFTFQSLIAKKLGFVKKVVMHVGENIAFNNEGLWGRRWLKHFAIKNTDVFVAITEQAKKVLIEEGADSEKIVRATPGVDLRLFRPPKKYKRNKVIKLLVISRLVPEKGIAEIAELFKALHIIYENVHLTVVGSGPEKEKLENLHGVEIIPRLNQNKLVGLYQTCDIFVHYPKGSPTWQEQFGFVLVEAMACGLPVVALDRGSTKEVVADGGFVVKAADYEKTLVGLIENKKLRDECGKKAFEYAKKHYDVNNYSSFVEQVITS